MAARQIETKAIKDNLPEKVKQARMAKEMAILSMVKNACDCITGSDSIKKPAPVFGWAYSEGFCASMGLLSALVGNRQIYLQISNS